MRIRDGKVMDLVLIIIIIYVLFVLLVCEGNISCYLFSGDILGFFCSGENLGKEVGRGLVLTGKGEYLKEA